MSPIKTHEGVSLPRPIGGGLEQLDYRSGLRWRCARRKIGTGGDDYNNGKVLRRMHPEPRRGHLARHA